LALLLNFQWSHFLDFRIRLYQPTNGLPVGLETIYCKPKEFGARGLPQRGDQGLVADPDGAMLGVIHSTSGDPGEFLPDMGDWTWSELFSPHTAEAALFYQTIIGYEQVPDKRPASPKNIILVSGGYSTSPRARPWGSST